MTKKKSENRTPDADVPTRRRFLNWIWAGLGAAAAAEVAWLVVTYLRPRAQPRDADDGLLTAGPADAFAPDTVTAFPRGRFYLARLADGGFLALSRRCTHLGCTVPWNADTRRFECPCHASVFDIRGDVVRAPAQRALDLHPVVIENGIVMVDTTAIIKRGAFQQDQVVYSK